MSSFSKGDLVKIRMRLSLPHGGKDFYPRGLVLAVRESVLGGSSIQSWRDSRSPAGWCFEVHTAPVRDEILVIGLNAESPTGWFDVEDIELISSATGSN